MLGSHDIVVVGGGIVGSSTAMTLAEQGLDVAVVEAEERLAVHQTGHNSGVIHSGLYYAPGSLKARLCVQGREALYAFLREEGIRHERCGKVVVAVDHGEVDHLRHLYHRGRENGLEHLEWLDEGGIREHEPHVAGIAGIWVPYTGIVDYAEVVSAYARRVEAAGGEILTGTRFVGLASRREDGPLELSTTEGAVSCRVMVNCAGLHADRVARACGLEPGLKIVPFRGEYYDLVPEKRSLVRGLVYPVPDPRYPFLGVHLTRRIGGTVDAGPNAVLALARHGYSWSDVTVRDLLDTLGYVGFWRMATRHWRTGISETWRSISKGAFTRSVARLLPGITSRDLVPGTSGVRAQAMLPDGSMVDDFRFVVHGSMLHVLNAPSPAATASISIGRVIATKAAALLRGEDPGDQGEGPGS